MTILDRKLLRDLRQSWHMLLAVSAIIAVGIGCFVGMLSAAKNLEFARSSYYSSCRLADIWIDLKKAPAEEVKRLAMIPGISEIRERIQFQVLLDLAGTEKPIGTMVISLPDKEEPVINNIIIRTGAYFTHGRANEVIISEKFAKARSIVPGDRIFALLNNQREELIVVGTAISAEFVYMVSPGSMIDDPGSYGLMYIKQSFAEDIFGFNGACNSVVGLLAPEARQEAERIVKTLSDRLEPYGVFAALSRAEQFSPMILDGELKELNNMAFIFPSFFLVVATLLLNVLMIRLAEQQRTVIGTLKAIGYENRALMFHFLKFAVTAGLAGGSLGCLFGYWLAGVNTRMYVQYFSFPQLTNMLYPSLLLAGLSVSILFSILGTLKGIGHIMRLDPAEAMRPAAPPLGGAVFLERIHLFWHYLDVQWQMILRGLLRNKGRTAVAVISAAMGSSIVVLTFGFVDSLDEMVRQQFDTVLRSDYHLTFQNEMDFSTLDEIRRFPGVIHAEPVFIVPCTFRVQNHFKRSAIMGIPPNGELTAPTNGQGERIPMPGTGLLMTDRLMERLGISAGDSVAVLPVKGERRTLTLPVVEGISSMVGMMVYADYNWLNHVLRQEPVISEVRVLTAHGPTEKRAFMNTVRTMPGLEILTDLGEQKDALNRQLNGMMRYSAIIMILFAAVIFFGAILNGTLIAISERRVEMATFRAIGYYESEVARLFLRENLLINVIGTLIGLPLGYWLLTGIMQLFITDAYSFPAKLNGLSYIYTVALAVLFVLSSQGIVRRTLRKQNWVEALSLKE
ncbi:MAG: FtsX-like permease family protein [Proteobacteria bacterium]|nr:FtsX-like permease family protein [Pseudomonadota bacterium]MBU1058414.1 FtsX-like permease family protein [Pseudomonadota bacterium]